MPGTGQSEDSVRAEFLSNVKWIHRDLIRGDLARQEAASLRARLQSCEVRATSLEGSLQAGRAKESQLSEELAQSRAETAQERRRRRSASLERWFWRAAAAGYVIFQVSTALK